MIFLCDLNLLSEYESCFALHVPKKAGFEGPTNRDVCRKRNKNRQKTAPGTHNNNNTPITWTTWRIGTHDGRTWLIGHGYYRFLTGVIGTPHGLFMAYEGVTNHLLNGMILQAISTRISGT